MYLYYLFLVIFLLSLMNQESLQQKAACKQVKRTKERYIGEAMDLVDKWRSLFSNKYQDDVGQSVRYSLDQAAELVGVSRKTLEDYYYTLRKVRQCNLADLEQLRSQKMGIIRQVIKKYKNLTPKPKKVKKLQKKDPLKHHIEKEEDSETIELKLEYLSDDWEQNNLAYQNQLISMDALDFIRDD